MSSNRFDISWRPVIIGLVVLGVLFIYGWLDPAKNPFPPCPFRTLTGWLCPGCGSQRALHALLHFRLSDAIRLNPLFLPGLTYVLAGFILPVVAQQRWAAWRRTWFGSTAAWVALGMILIFWIGRNLLDAPAPVQP